MLKKVLNKGLIIAACFAVLMGSMVFGRTFSPYATRHTNDLKIWGKAWFNSGYKTTQDDAIYGVEKNKYIKQCWVRIKEGNYDDRKFSESYTKAQAKSGEAYAEKRNIPFINATITWGWIYN